MFVSLFWIGFLVGFLAAVGCFIALGVHVNKEGK